MKLYLPILTMVAPRGPGIRPISNPGAGSDQDPPKKVEVWTHIFFRVFQMWSKTRFRVKKKYPSSLQFPPFFDPSYTEINSSSCDVYLYALSPFVVSMRHVVISWYFYSTPKLSSEYYFTSYKQPWHSRLLRTCYLIIVTIRIQWFLYWYGPQQ